MVFNRLRGGLGGDAMTFIVFICMLFLWDMDDELTKIRKIMEGKK